MAEPAKAQPSAGACIWPGPADLRDPVASAKITFNWLKSDVVVADAGPPAPVGTFLLVLALIIFAPMALVWALCLFMDWRSAVLIGVIFAVILLVLVYVYIGLGPSDIRPKPTIDKRGAARLRAWKIARTRIGFWKGVAASGRGYAFEVECAELMAAIYQTRDVWITRQHDDYGVDVIACKDGKRYVAQCKLARNRPPSINVIRELAGSTCYFGAAMGLLFSMQKVHESRTQAGEFARVCHLQFWDVEAILLLTNRLAYAGAPQPGV